MPKPLLELLVAAFVATSATSAIGGQTTAPAEKLDPQELVVGDWYEATVQRQQVKQKLSGYLVMADDDWLVLGVIMAEGRVTGTPWIAELPYIGAPFRTSQQAITRIYQWIPRPAAKLNEHTSYPNQAGFEDFRGDLPKLGSPGWVTVAEQGKASSESYELVGVDGRQLRAVVRKTELQKGEPSRWSGLPFVGGLFNTDHCVTRQVEQPVLFDDVLYVRQSSLYDLKKHQVVSAADIPDWFRN